MPEDIDDTAVAASMRLETPITVRVELGSVAVRSRPKYVVQRGRKTICFQLECRAFVCCFSNIAGSSLRLSASRAHGIVLRA